MAQIPADNEELNNYVANGVIEQLKRDHKSIWPNLTRKQTRFQFRKKRERYSGLFAPMYDKILPIN